MTTSHSWLFKYTTCFLARIAKHADKRKCRIRFSLRTLRSWREYHSTEQYQTANRCSS